MQDIRRVICWVFAFEFLLHLVISLRSILYTSRGSYAFPPLSNLLVTPWFSAVVATVCVAAWWTGWRGKTSARGWGIAASLVNILIFLRPILLPSRFVWDRHAGALVIGAVGLVVFSRRELTAAEVLRRYKDEQLMEFSEIPIEDINQVGSLGDRPLNVACARGNLDEIAALIDVGADVNAPGGHGGTPLHSAVEQGHVRAIDLLLDHGASLDARDESGATPLDLARTLRRADAVRLLEKRTPPDRSST